MKAGAPVGKPARAAGYQPVQGLGENANEPPMTKIAYIAPELTALSETFVYAELLAVEAAGFEVVPFCVRRPGHPAPEAQVIADRTAVLYDRPPWRVAATGAAAALSFGKRGWRALRMVLGDMAQVGVLHAASWKLLYQWLVAARMARIVQAQGCTHIHAHFLTVPTQIAMYASAFTGIPFTATGHANDIYENALLLREKAQRARALLTISHFNKRYLTTMGVAAAHVDVVRCAPYFEMAAPARPTMQGAPFKIGTLCRLVEKKGVEDLIHAVASVCATGANVKLSIAGDGPQRAALEAVVRSYGFASRVEFLGALDHRGVAAWMSSLHLFALACRADRHGDIDGIPVVLMEAMALGVPVLSTRISGIPELVIDGHTGLLAEPADRESLARRIQQSLHSKTSREHMSEAGRAHVAAEFGRALNMQRLLRHFEP
jgi:glycosyltransferase involved in cell wall biosynthesis